MPKVNTATILLAISVLYSAILLHGRTNAAARHKEDSCSTDGFFKVPNSDVCYKIFMDKVCNWANAEKLCKSQNLQIADEPKDIKALFRYIRDTYDESSYWVGARDKTGSGTFTWFQSGNPIPPEMEGSGAPLEYSKDGCLAMAITTWSLNDDKDVTNPWEHPPFYRNPCVIDYCDPYIHTLCQKPVRTTNPRSNISKEKEKQVDMGHGKNIHLSCGGYYDDVPGTIAHPSISGSDCGYNSNEICTWVISSSRPLAFYFTDFNLEEDYDHVIIRDGGSIGSPLIEKLSGKSLQTNFTTAGDAHIRFESDTSVVGTGFVLHWRYYSAEEQCRDKNGVCVFTGDRCDGTFDLIENSCDDRCACCVPDNIGMQQSRKSWGISSGNWRGPLNNIWSDDECQNLKNDVKPLSECQAACMEDLSCTAINYNPTSNGCTLRGCQEPVRSPQSHYPPHQGYYIIKPGNWRGPLNKIWGDDQCQNLKNDVKSLSECQAACVEDLTCTAINYNPTSNGCTLRGCQEPVRSPQWHYPPHQGYYIEILGSCGTTYTSSSGHFTSPNYPGNHGNNENCVWVISAPAGKRIVLSFKDFKLQKNYDYLYIRDGDTSDSTLLHILTGDEHNAEDSTFSDVVSSGNHLHITFTSDSSIAKSGFYISWEFEWTPPMAIIEQYAPKLRFDSKFGDPEKCFPSSAADYYDVRASGNNNRICNTNYDTMDGDVPTYWRAMECGDNLHIAYWFFSGYQDTCMWGQGSHNSDWEHVIVKVENYKSKSHSLGPVQFYQHNGWYTKNPGQYEVDGTHPIVYSGKNSHGSYHDDGGSGGCCYWEDFRKPGSKNMFMRTWLNLEELRRTDSAPVFMKDLSSKDKFEMSSPLERSETYEMCQLPGCNGPKLLLCHTGGCYKSQVNKDEIF